MSSEILLAFSEIQPASVKMDLIGLVFPTSRQDREKAAIIFKSMTFVLHVQKMSMLKSLEITLHIMNRHLSSK